MTNDRVRQHRATDRRVLTGDAYETDRHLVTRQRLYRLQRPRHDLPAIVADQIARRSGVLIDVGCGNGRYTRHLRQRHSNLTVVGVDLSAGILVKVAPPVLAADITALPLAEESVTTALAMHMLYHVPEPDAGLRELSRVLAPGGVLVVSTNARDDKVELRHLWARAVADVLDVPDTPRWTPLNQRFPLDAAPGTLARHFTDVRLINLRSTITAAEPDPVVAYLDSCRAWAPLDDIPFDAALERAHQRLTDTIDRDGVFTVTCHSGVFTCRKPGRRAESQGPQQRGKAHQTR